MNETSNITLNKNVISMILRFDYELTIYRG